MNSGFQVRALPSAKRVSRPRLRGAEQGEPGRVRQAFPEDRQGRLSRRMEGRTAVPLPHHQPVQVLADGPSYQPGSYLAMRPSANTKARAAHKCGQLTLVSYH